jgi:uncharacterized protein (DUF433 family)
VNLPEFLTLWPNGEIALTGPRIDLFHFVDFYNEGNSVRMLLGLFPTLNLALIHKVIAWHDSISSTRTREECSGMPSLKSSQENPIMNRPETLIRLLPPCLHWSSDGEVRVVGRRIGLFHIVKAHRELGKSPETIAEEFELARELIAEVLAFAEDHKAEVGTYLADYQAELDRQYAAYQPSPAALRISRLVAERQARESRSDS